MKITELLENIKYYIYTRGIRRLIPKYCDRTIFTKFYWRALKDRHQKGYDETELWSLDYSLTKLIAPRIKDFASREKVGIPGWILEEEHRASIKKGYEWDNHHWRLKDKREETRCYKRATARWNSILNEIAEGFEDMRLFDENWDAWNEKWKPIVAKWQKKIDKAKTFRQKQTIWNQIGSFREYRNGITVESEDVTYYLHQKALDLLAKHYHNLWD